MRFSKEEMHENMIGKLYFEPISFEDLLEIGEKRIYDLGVSPNDFLIIDDQIIVASSDRCLAIYDKQFNLVKRIDTINGETFAAIATQANGCHIRITLVAIEVQASRECVGVSADCDGVWKEELRKMRKNLTKGRFGWASIQNERAECIRSEFMFGSKPSSPRR